MSQPAAPTKTSLRRLLLSVRENLLDALDLIDAAEGLPEADAIRVSEAADALGTALASLANSASPTNA